MRKNIATKHVESHKAKKRYQADTLFLLDYLVRNTVHRYLFSIFDHLASLDIQLECMPTLE